MISSSPQSAQWPGSTLHDTGSRIQRKGNSRIIELINLRLCLWPVISSLFLLRGSRVSDRLQPFRINILHIDVWTAIRSVHISDPVLLGKAHAQESPSVLVEMADLEIFIPRVLDSS